MQNSKVSAIDGISGRDSQAGIQPDSLSGAFKDIRSHRHLFARLHPFAGQCGRQAIPSSTPTNSNQVAFWHLVMSLRDCYPPYRPFHRKSDARPLGTKVGRSRNRPFVSTCFGFPLNVAQRATFPSSLPAGDFSTSSRLGSTILRSRCMQTGDASAASCPARAKRSPTASMKRFDSRLIAAPAFASPSTSTVPRVLLPATFEMLASSAASFPLLTCFRRKIASGGFACFETVLIFPAISPISSCGSHKSYLPQKS